MWIINSGASDHMVFDKILLSNIGNLQNPILITLLDGNKVKVSQFGDSKLGKNLILHHVLFVPYFQFHLLSVKRLTEQLKCDVVFSEHACVLQGPSLKRPLELGKSTQGLYILDEAVSEGLELKEIRQNKCSFTSSCFDKKQFTDQYSFSCSRSQSLANLWHKRMGHVSFESCHTCLFYKILFAIKLVVPCLVIFALVPNNIDYLFIPVALLPPTLLN